MASWAHLLALAAVGLTFGALLFIGWSIVTFVPTTVRPLMPALDCVCSCDGDAAVLEVRTKQREVEP